MAEQKTIESPEFDRIKKEAGPATRDAVQTLWFVANNQAEVSRRGVRYAQEEELPKTKMETNPASMHNYDTEGCPVIVVVFSIAVSLTGIRNGLQGMARSFYNLGVGDLAVKHESTLSDAFNRLDLRADATVTVTTGNCIKFRYLNGRWRQEVYA